MTAIVPIVSRGVTLLQSVSSVYVAMQALTKISVTGKKSETTPSVVLDGGVFKTKSATGYADPPTLKASGLYAPAHATYTAFEGLIAAPVPTNFKVTWTDSGQTSVIYSGVGFGIDVEVEPSKLVMANIEIELSGAPS